MYSLFSRYLVIDANILGKILRVEGDSQIAREFLSYCNENNIGFIAPSLFKYEVVGIGMKHNVAMSKTLAILASYQQNQLSLIEPDIATWLLAEKICQDGHPKSGHPSMYDSIYHAMAIQHNTNFITADNRHFVKAKQYGSIKLLENWQSLFSEK